MPGNEFGERVHNFFPQEGLSQDQHRSQVDDGSWSSFCNGLVGNPRQINPSLIANLRSYSTQQSVDPERAQSSNAQHGLNFSQQLIRSEYSENLLQEHQQFSNDYMHGNLVLQTMSNEANCLGVDVESSRDKSSEKGFPPDLHRFEMRVTDDFFSGHQQLNSQLPGMLQPRQQMTFNDMQLLKQMQEYQMQQQLQKQQLEARQHNSMYSNGSRSGDDQSHPLIKDIPCHDASSNCCQPEGPELMTGLMITPEHRQAYLLAQQLEPSLYGMPVGGTNAPQNAFSSVQTNWLATQHGLANRSTSLTSQPSSSLNQDGVQDRHQEQLLVSHTSVPGSNQRPNFESFQQDDSCERNISVEKKFGTDEGTGPSEKSYMKMPENITTLQRSTPLDPTEEKILFGSDDTLWEALGNRTDMSLTGNLMSSSSDLYDACPSLQCGSWSALMQSAVAETSSDGTSVHEWVNNMAPHANSHMGNWAQDSSVKASNNSLHSDSTQTAVQHFHNRGNKVSDQRSKMAGNIFHSSSSGIDVQNYSFCIRKNEGTEDRLGIWKATSNPNLAAMKEQNNQFTQNLQMQSASYGAGNESRGSRDVQGNMQTHLDDNSIEKAIPQLKSRDCCPILESYASNNAGSYEMGNSRKENPSDSFRPKFSPESFTCGFQENTQVNARDLSMLPGGKEKQSSSRSDGLVRDGLNYKESANCILHFGQTVSQSSSNKNPAASAGADHQQISCQIAPYGTNQYGAFKNELVAVDDTWRFTPSRIGEQYSNIGNLVDGSQSVQSSKPLITADPGYVHMQQMSVSTPGAEASSSESLPIGATDKLKKRKIATSELLSWNKEVLEGHQRLKTLSEAEVDWARATNRFAEKVEFETLLEDGPPIRTKRRLICTTQLMQQLFRPPPSRVISLVARSNYEFVVYSAARAALGDACSSTSTGRSERFLPPDNSNQLSERRKTEKTSDQYISKAAEDLISRTRKLEMDFAALENGTTIPDLRLEIQDLERFAVINRFASFHQSYSSMDRTMSTVRLNPERYITIAPIPKNIPDRVHCLSF